MRCNSKFLGLPASILLLVISQTSAFQPGHDSLSTKSHPRKIEEIESLVEAMNLVGVMKMSLDEGEKFYPEYWQYGQVLDVTAKLKVLSPKDESSGPLANVSMHFAAPLGIHTNREAHYDDLKARKLLEGRNSAAALAMLEKRDFVCPTGYNSCAAIGYPNSCCSTSETCFPILDTGLGPVGCCENGYTCGGTISTCGVNTACPSNLGGGCCIPGFVCAGVGCVMSPTVVTTTITQIFTVSIFPSSTHLTTIVTVSTSTESPVTSSKSSSSLLEPSSTTTTTSTTISTVLQTGTSTGTGIIPVRPTSISSSPTTSSTITDTETSCPTGFYGCSAYYQGGCCRTGRDCNTTSCPPISSTAIINGVATVVVPIGSAATVTSPTGVCATGWSSCAATVGGDCCPSGYVCGTASCTSVSATQTAVQQKASPSSAGRQSFGKGAVTFGVLGAFWVGMGLMLI